MLGYDPPLLVERESELDRIAVAVRTACEGAGTVLVVEGPAGIGKTRLLAAARHCAERAGMRVLGARGGELEVEFPYGVARQLFERVLAAAQPKQREMLLGGAAHLAAPVLGVAEPGAGAPVPDAAFAARHGLYWLTANLVADCPLLLVVDDAHWSDRASLAWLRYLAGRMEGLAVCVILAARPGEPGTAYPELAALAEDDSVEEIQLAPLSEAGVAEFVRRISPDAHEAFCSAAHRVTRGNPFFLRELLTALPDDDLPFSAASALRLAQLGSKTVARSVLVRLGRLALEAGDLARAVAILGTNAELRDAAALAGIDVRTAGAAADALAAAEILAPQRPLEFAHPIVRTAIYAHIPAAERASAHARAAVILADRGAPADQLALHLLATEPQGRAPVVKTLREAARQAIVRGVPDVAATYLRRAWREPPPGDARADLMHELAQAELTGREPSAFEHLRMSIELTAEPGARAQRALGMARALGLAAYQVEALDVCRAAIADAAELETQLRLRLEAELIANAWNGTDTAQLGYELLRGLGRGVEGGPDRHPLVQTLRGTAMISGGGDADAGAELIKQALAGGLLAESDSVVATVALLGLTFADELELVRAVCDAGLADARRRGSRHLTAALAGFGAYAAFLEGALEDAEAGIWPALEFNLEHPASGLAVPWPLSCAINVSIERAELAFAEDALQRSGIEGELGSYLALGAPRFSRGRLRCAQGRVREGADDLVASGRVYVGLGAAAPTVGSWRSSAALALGALGEREQASALACEELQLARASGARRALGIALRGVALVAGDAVDLDLLRESVEVLERTPARLEHARSLAELGAALRRANRRTEARAYLREALHLAERCGGRALAASARDELLATGARPRRALLRGADALTPSERRVARMAAEDASNRDIAQALFLSERTVELHLTHAYRKLDIGSRRELGHALQPGGALKTYG